MAAEHDRDWGGLRQCSRLVTATQLPWGWVPGGGGVQGEGSSEDVQGSGWLKNHLLAISVQHQFQ